MHLIVCTDGGARGNPGPSAIGVSITEPDGTEVASISERIGSTTNNVAEYTAVVRGLALAAELGADEVTLRSDSELLVRQLEGRYRVKASHLQPLHADALATLRGFSRFTLEHVRRERNVRADALVNEALDAV
jgi:ribonuclease HI